MGTSDRPGSSPEPSDPPASVRKFVIPELTTGVGALAEVGDATRRLGGRRVLVVTDPGLLAAGWADAALVALRAAGLACELWCGVTPNPKDHEIAAGHAVYAARGCDALVAVGGGSCIDAAKGIAVVSTNGGEILDYEGIDRISQPIPPLVMVPTTAGTGADVSQFAVITDTRRRLKATLISRALVPDISLVDPRVLTSMPPELTAATGLDALSHAVESYLSLGASFLTDLQALAALRLIAEHLPRSLDAPDDLAERGAMAQASLLAGLAFTNAILGATHALSHQIGGALDLPHGLLNGILLPHVMRFNAPAVPERLADVARALGAAGEGMGTQEAGEAACEHVRLMADKLGIPRGLAEIGLSDSDLPLFAEATLADACISTNPRPVTLDDVATIYRAAL